MTPPPDPVAALAEALHSGGWVQSPLGCTQSRGWTDLDTGEARHEAPRWFDCQWSAEHSEMAASILANLPAGWSLVRRSEQEALVAALEGLWEAANRYRQDVAKANEYLNQDLPSARSLVFALGKARAAIEGRP